MAQLAIKGHSTRGKEVIEILGILGGSNVFGYFGNNPLAVYYIDEKYKNYISCSRAKRNCDCIIFTLEEFLEKFPYKVGDKVQHKGATSCGSVFEIEKMRWVNNDVKYTIKRLWYNNCYSTVTVKDLQLYKEEKMDNAVFDANAQCCDIMNHLIKKETMEEKLEQITLDIPDGYEFFCINDDNKVVLAKKQLQYPKTYEECCDVLKIEYPYFKTEEDGISASAYKNKLIGALKQLLICRDAYWKMAGEQKGEPWQPDWNTSEIKYTIVECAGRVVKTSDMCNKRFIAFPTEEMRDAFYEKFKYLIKQCKELL